MANVIEQLHVRAQKRPQRIVFPEAQDPRVVEAVKILSDRELVDPVVIRPADGKIDTSIMGLESVSLDNDELRSQCANQLFENRKHKGLSRSAAEDAIGDPLLFASLLVKIGFVDGAVAGSQATTANVIRAAFYGIGTAAGNKTISSCFLMQLADRALTYADCGVVPDPDADQLADIAIAAADSHQSLTGEIPIVAMLSFSTLGSANHPRVEKIRNAVQIARSRKPDLALDGELQFDAAFDSSIASRKAPDSEVAGQANVFVFPDLDAGNIAYKITERLAKATALGPLIQGLDRPFMDLSRGCSAHDIVDVAVIASVLS